MRNSSRERRVRELLADRALMGLSPDAQAELDELGEVQDDVSYESAAAAAFLALLPDRMDPLPGDLRKRLEASLCGGSRAETDTTP